jgi:predicted nucleotidyltransferase
VYNGKGYIPRLKKVLLLGENMESELIGRIKRAINAIEPGAEVILYGSRARGDSQEYSDWDFLVLVDGEVDYKRAHQIRHQLHEIEWDTGEVLCAIVRNRRDWENPLNRVTSLAKNIRLEGVIL